MLYAKWAGLYRLPFRRGASLSRTGGPSTRTLLLTDVVDSTKLSEELGDVRMAELWARHDRIARDLLPVHRGREIDKTDGFLMLFDAASDAVAYAVAYHRALRALGIAARAGIHVGPVILTENAAADVARGAKPLEVDGLAKPTAARVMSLATGGQTLLSASAREAVGETALRVESHGHWRMKGVSEPLELFEVGDEDAPFRPPPDGAKVYRVVLNDGLWLPVREVPHSLPAERDAFVGRRSDLRELHQRVLDGARLVSILGTGGTGKTRLTLQYGWSWLGDWPGGVWFCDLAEARSLDDVVRVVARVFDVPLGPEDQVARLGRAIRGRGPCLVLLDNFEQVAEHAEPILGSWLDLAPEATFFVTTREVLGIRGEAVVGLPPLSESDAVALFVARARAAKVGFELTEANEADVRALVDLLDRLPLAIELAAARIRALAPSAILERMGQRFRLLASARGRNDRHATLRAALDWSWNLLDADERDALAQLSVFEGGVSLDAAEAVLQLGELWPMDALQALVDKSLVRQTDEARYGLLVSVQEYAAEQLGERRAETERRHAAHFATLGEDRALAALGLGGDLTGRETLVAELGNLLAAARRSVAEGDGETASPALAAAWAVIALQGPYGEADRLARAILGLPDLTPEARFRTLGIRAGAALHTRDLEGHRAALAEGLAIAETLGIAAYEVRCRTAIGMDAVERGAFEEAAAHLDRALALAQALGDRPGEADVLRVLLLLRMRQGDLDGALAAAERGLGIAREIGDRRREGGMLHNVAMMRQSIDLDRSREDARAALALHRLTGNRSWEANTLLLLASLSKSGGGGPLAAEARRVYESIGDAYGVARALGMQCFNAQTEGRLEGLADGFRRLLEHGRELGDMNMVGMSLGCLGRLALYDGELDSAEALLNQALEVHQQIGFTPPQQLWRIALAQLEAIRGRIDAAEEHVAVAVSLAEREARSDWLWAVLADAHLLVGDVVAARARLPDVRSLDIATAVGSNGTSRAVLVEARIRIAEGRLDEAVALIDEIQARLDLRQTEADYWTRAGVRTLRGELAGAPRVGPLFDLR